MGGSADPRNPEQFRSGLTAANQLSTSDVGQVCATCPDNWVEAGAVDETSGKPLPGLGYRIYDIATGDLVASGVLNAEGKSPRHNIPMPVTQLYAVFGTEKAMDEAEAKISELRREQALQANAVKDWRGIPSGLNEEQFNQAYDDQVRANGGRWEKPSVGLLEGAGYGANMAYDYVSSGFDSDYMLRELYADDRRRNFEEYQLATNARQASNSESFWGGSGQGVTFGFGEEAMAGLGSLFSDRSYEELVEERRQLQRAHQIANPNFYMGGEIAGAVPTIFVPVGGAAGRAVQAGKGATGAIRAGAATGAATGAISGAGHDEGGFVDRLDGAALGAATGGVAGAVLSGAGVLIARGVSRTRIWAKVKGRVPPKREPWHNPNLGDEWYDPKTGELRWPNTETTGYPDGFSATPVKETLPVGTRIDRYSAKVGEMDTGNFLSPAGASYESRALPWNQATQNYSVYEVVKPLPVDSGTAIPWFGSSGGATQFKTGSSVGDLIRGGFLEPVK